MRIALYFGVVFTKRNIISAWRTRCTFGVETVCKTCPLCYMLSFRALGLHWVMHWPFGVSDFPSCFLQPQGKRGGEGGLRGGLATDWQHDNIVQSLPNLSSPDSRPVISSFPLL